MHCFAIHQSNAKAGNLSAARRDRRSEKTVFGASERDWFMEDNIVRTFYSDASHNYMVIECPHELRDNYQYKMLAANQIRGLLPCSSRSIDNREYLYYDITSRQSIEDLYDRRPVRGTDVEKLLEDLLRVGKTLTEYLLDASHMILDPSCIYMDFRGNESSFVYYPGEVGEAGWGSLFSFLADRVDGKDKRAAALVYRLCMMAENPGFMLREETLEELGLRLGKGRGSGPAGTAFEPWDMREEGRYGSGRTNYPAAGDRPGNDRSARGRQNYDPQYASDYAPEYGRSMTPDAGSGSLLYEFGDAGEKSGRGGGGNVDYDGCRRGETETGSGDRRKGKGLLSRSPFPAYVFSALMAAAGTGLFFLHRIILLEERLRILSLAAGALLVLAGFASALVHLIRRHRPRAEESADAGSDGRYPEQEERAGLEELLYGRGAVPDQRDAPGRPGSARTPVQGEGGRGQTGRYGGDDIPVLSEYSDQRAASGAGMDPEGRFSRGGMRDGMREAGNEGRFSLSMPGETSILGPDTGKPLALYGTGTFRGEKISLADLPCVVGKMQEYVDQVLDDSSVSRMHARFSLDRDGKMTVRDLNSTNGTWLNGERLMPNESRAMHQGDHVRLGCMEFVYR